MEADFKQLRFLVNTLNDHVIYKNLDKIFYTEVNIVKNKIYFIIGYKEKDKTLEHVLIRKSFNNTMENWDECIFEQIERNMCKTFLQYAICKKDEKNTLSLQTLLKQ